LARLCDPWSTWHPARNRLEQPLAVAEVDPELLQIGIGTIPQDIAGDAVPCESLLMMA
jgi:hypothetical protein